MHYTAILKYFGRGFAFADDLLYLSLRCRIQNPALFASYFCAVSEIQFFVFVLAYTEQRNAVIAQKLYIDNKFSSEQFLEIQSLE